MSRSLRIRATSLARNVLGETAYDRLRSLSRGPDYPAIGKVRFGHLRRTEPISREYGYDRGLPIDRYYIENYLKSQGQLITGDVLEIGERTYTERFGQNVTRSDMLHAVEEEGATYVDDLSTAETIPSNLYDCVILTQTLHLIFDMRAALQSIYRILKPGGVLLCTVPGITQIADTDWNHSWYWSLSKPAADKLFGLVFPPGNVEVRAFGNVLSATCFLQGLAATELRHWELEEFDHEYPVTVAIAARKGTSDQREPMEDRWTYAANAEFPYDEETSYRLGMEFLDGEGLTIEDWGAGAGFARRLVTLGRYVGIDGSAGDPEMVKADLQDYRSEADCIFMRHVLEHNWGWRHILGNAAVSFRKRMVLIVFTPLGDSEKRLDNDQAIPDLQLSRAEILGFFEGFKVREQTIRSVTQYGTETLFYVEK